MLSRTVRPIAVLLAAATLAVCTGLPTGPCTLELRIRLNPQDTTIPVGASYRARVELSSCGGRERLSDRFTWTAADPTVVRVDAPTGRITGLAAGETQVAVEGERYGRLGGIRVTVRARAP